MQVFQAQLVPFSLSPFALQAFLGVAAAAIICLLSRRLRLLSPNGAFAAFLVGSVIFALGGWQAALPLLVFYGTSNAWGRWRRARKAGLALEKGGPRDAWQVLANGGLPTLAVLAGSLVKGHAALWHLVYIAAIAEANADTWATEIGAASQEAPRLITTMKRVPAGRSGAVSLTGTLAAGGGSFLIGLGALPLFNTDRYILALAIVTGAGAAGAIADSVLGATLQYETGEGVEHGVRWIGNDLVNFAAGALASIFAVLCSLAFPI